MPFYLRMQPLHKKKEKQMKYLISNKLGSLPLIHAVITWHKLRGQQHSFSWFVSHYQPPAASYWPVDFYYDMTLIVFAFSFCLLAACGIHALPTPPPSTLESVCLGSQPWQFCIRTNILYAASTSSFSEVHLCLFVTQNHPILGGRWCVVVFCE